MSLILTDGYILTETKPTITTLSPTSLFPSTSCLLDNYIFILYIPKARTVLLVRFAQHQAHHQH